MTHEHHHEPEPAHEHHHHDYPAEVADYRARKDAYFREAASSPIPLDAARVLPGSPTSPSIRSYGSKGSGSNRTRAASRSPSSSRRQTASFAPPTARARSRSTWAASADARGIHDRWWQWRIAFVPFLDATSGRETYGAGRYLDLEPEGDGTYSLDFNMAYHPFCVFAPSYSCPLTPAENRLPIRIEAGERLPEAAPAR